MSGCSYVIDGDDAHDTVTMILFMADYLAGPGLDGFTAWTDQQFPHAPVNRAVIQGNLQLLASTIKAAH